MPYLSKFIHSLSAGSVAVVAIAAPAAADSHAENERLRKSAEVLQALVATPDDAIPEHILARAEAIVVIPTLVKGGFVVGAEHGKGVMSVRQGPGGAWSLPSFVAMTGGSIGWQVGVQSTDLVLLVMNKEGVSDLMKSEFKLGADASVAAGPVGRSAQAATDARMTAKILAYSRAKGLFAGVSVQGSTLTEDKDANAAFYGRTLTSTEVFARPATPAPDASKGWLTTLGSVARASR